MSEVHDYDRQFDEDVYDKEYFEGPGKKSGYHSYEQARGIIRAQFDIIDRIMHQRVKQHTHLDVGCAYGYGPKFMQERGWDSAGFDIAPFAIEMAQKKFGENLPIVVGDARDDKVWEGFENKSVGLITGVEFFEHIHSDDVARVLDNMMRVGEWGLFVINARTAPGQDPEASMGDHGHLNSHSVTWWIKALSRVGELDYTAMFEFNKEAERSHGGMNWHNRCIVVKFYDEENL